MPTLDRNTILAAIGYAVLTGIINLIFSRKSQIEAWCGANPRLAAFGKLLRAIGFDPHGVWAFMTLLITKKLPQVQLADGPAAMREIVKAEEKAEEKRRKGPPDDGGGGLVSLMPDPVREVAQDRSRLHNDQPDGAEMSDSWRHRDWRLSLTFGVLLACVVSCDPRKPPCDEAQLRAADEAFLADVAKTCLTKYDAADDCPQYPDLKAKHKADLRKVCPQ